MAMFLLAVWIIVSLFVGHVMVGVSHSNTTLSNQIGIRLLAFGWPLYPVYLLIGNFLDSLKR